MVFGLVISPIIIVAPSTGDVDNKSTPMTYPSSPTSSTATCVHPPG